MVTPHYRLVVSIVTYQSDTEQLTRALASLRHQCASMHIFVVDNASSEAYQETLRDVVAPYGEEVTLILAPRNGGFGYGHNLAMLNAPSSDFFLVLNPDVELHAGAAEHLMAFLEQHPDAGLVVPKVFYPDGRLQPLNKRRPNVLDLGMRLFLPPILTRLPLIRKRLDRYSMMDKGYDTPYRLPFASGCCMVFRRSIITRLGGFDEGFFLYFEDADITERVNIISEAWFCPDAIITHAWQRGSRRSFKLLGIMLMSAARYFAKWGLKMV
jgi:GT2 family glycosyltransferase